MTPSSNAEHYKNHRFPGEIISHGVWLYYRFPLSYRDVQESCSLAASTSLMKLSANGA